MALMSLPGDRIQRKAVVYILEEAIKKWFVGQDRVGAKQTNNYACICYSIIGQIEADLD